MSTHVQQGGKWLFSVNISPSLFGKPTVRLRGSIILCCALWPKISPLVHALNFKEPGVMALTNNNSVRTATEQILVWKEYSTFWHLWFFFSWCSTTVEPFPNYLSPTEVARADHPRQLGLKPMMVFTSAFGSCPSFVICDIVLVNMLLKIELPQSPIRIFIQVGLLQAP